MLSAGDETLFKVMILFALFIYLFVLWEQRSFSYDSLNWRRNILAYSSV